MREEPCLEAYEPQNNVTFIWITALLDLLFENIWPKTVRRWTEAPETVDGVLETYLVGVRKGFWHRFRPINSSFGTFAGLDGDSRNLGMRFGL